MIRVDVHLLPGASRHTVEERTGGHAASEGEMREWADGGQGEEWPRRVLDKKTLT